MSSESAYLPLSRFSVVPTMARTLFFVIKNWALSVDAQHHVGIIQNITRVFLGRFGM